MFEIFVQWFFLLLPFQWALSPLPGIDLALVRALSIFLIFFWLFEELRKNKIFFPNLLSIFFLTGFLFVSSLSFFWAKDPQFAFRKIIFLWNFLPLFVVLTSLFFQESGQKKFERTLQFFLSGACAIAFLSLLQFLSQFIFGVEKVFHFWTEKILPFFLGSTFGEAVASYPSLLVNISGKTFLRASGFFPDPHMFSFYMGISIPIALFFFSSGEGKEKKKFAFGLFLLILADLLSFSRGGYIGMVLGGLFFIGMYFFSHQISIKKILGGLGIFLVMTLIFFFSPVGSRFSSSFSPLDGSNAERLRLWGEGISLMKTHPFLGVGLGNYPLLVKPTATYREPIYAHNLFLDIILETGLVGLGFFLLFFFWALFRYSKHWIQKRSLLSLCLSVALLIFFGHAFFETPLFSVHILPLLVLLLSGAILEDI